MPRNGTTLALKIILCFAALFTIPLLLFWGQLRWTLILAVLITVFLVAVFWTRSKAPTD